MSSEPLAGLPEIEFNTSFVEHISAKVKEITSFVDPRLEPLLHDSILTTRHTSSTNRESIVELPTSESIREQLLAKVTSKDENGKSVIDHEEVEKRVSKLYKRAQNGYFFYADAHKLQIVSDTHGKAAGDAYIAGNHEVLARAAEKLKCDIFFGIYSGDENCGIFIPQDGIEIDQNLIKTTISKITNEYYQGNNESGQFFKEMQKTVKDNYAQDMGMDIQLIGASAAKYKPTPDHELRDRQISSMIIDSVIIQKEEQSDSSLLDALFKTQLSYRALTDIEHERYPGKEYFPPEIAEKMQLAIDQGIDPKVAEAYAELSVYEPLFPGESRVRKIATLDADLKRMLNEGFKPFVFRFADTRLKEANKISHALGDNHLIATVNIFRRALKYQLAGQYEGDFDDNFFIYQHHGSFNLVVKKWQHLRAISSLMQDPQTLNAELFKTVKEEDKSSERRLKGYRAKPFIVGTSTIYTPDNTHIPCLITNAKDLESFWGNQNQHQESTLDLLRKQQIYNEVQTTMWVSGLAHQLPSNIINLINLITYDATKGASFEQFIHLLEKAEAFVFLANIFSNYVNFRPQRIDIALELIENFNKSFYPAMSLDPKEIKVLTKLAIPEQHRRNTSSS